MLSSGLVLCLGLVVIETRKASGIHQAPAEYSSSMPNRKSFQVECSFVAPACFVSTRHSSVNLGSSSTGQQTQNF